MRVKSASRFPRQESHAQHAVADEMALLFVVSAVLHTTALTEEAGAWNMVLGKRYQAGLDVYKRVCLPPGAQWPVRQIGATATRHLTHAVSFPFPFFLMAGVAAW